MRRPSLAFVIVAALGLPAFDWPSGAARWTAALSDPSPEHRRAAVREASASTDAEARRAVLVALDDADEGVRLEAAAAVSRGRLIDAAPALARWLDAPSPRIRLAATRGLGELRSATSLGALTRMLADADVGVRTEAVRAVARVGGAEVTVALLDRLSDADAAVRVETARALGTLGDRRAVFTLLGALQDAAVEVRVAAAESLGRLRDARALRGLVSLLGDPAPEARSAAVMALGALGRDTPDAVADLAVVALREGREGDAAAQSRLAVEAIAALGRIATPAACDVLLDVVRRGVELVDRSPAHAAFRALAAHAGVTRSRIPTLVAVTPPDFVDALVELLAEVGGDDAARAILGLLERADLPAGTRSRAWAGLGRTGSTLALLPLLSEAERVSTGPRVPPMRDCARTRLNAPALVGLEALSRAAGSLGPDALDLLGGLLDRVGDGCALQSSQVVTLLGRTGNARGPARIRPFLASPSQLVRRAAVGALQRAGVEGAEGELAALLGDPSSGVRLAASDALARHGGSAAVRALLDRWEGDGPLDRSAAARALGRSLRGAAGDLATRAVDTLARCAATSSPSVAAACVDALADALSRAPEDGLAGVTLRAWLAADATRALPALEAIANAAASEGARATRLRAWAEAALPAETLRDARTRAALASIGPDASTLRAALASGDPAPLANALAALRHATDPLDATLAADLWETLRTRRHEAVLVNATLLLARRGDASPDLDALASLLTAQPSERVRLAAATLARRAAELALEGPARARLEALLERCAAGDASARVRARCEARETPAGERAAIDARVVEGRGVASALVDYALVLPEGWIRLGTTGPDGWIHERVATEGTFQVLDPAELAADR